MTHIQSILCLVPSFMYGSSVQVWKVKKTWDLVTQLRPLRLFLLFHFSFTSLLHIQTWIEFACFFHKLFLIQC
jgi:hypothetical protein